MSPFILQLKRKTTRAAKAGDRGKRNRKNSCFSYACHFLIKHSDHILVADAFSFLPAFQFQKNNPVIAAGAGQKIKSNHTKYMFYLGDGFGAVTDLFDDSRSTFHGSSSRKTNRHKNSSHVLIRHKTGWCRFHQKNK